MTKDRNKNTPALVIQLPRSAKNEPLLSVADWENIVSNLANKVPKLSDDPKVASLSAFRTPDSHVKVAEKETLEPPLPFKKPARKKSDP